jgi:peptide/nickel transport system substrate-binding protein/microcin C transport system substrate-binding protein
MNNFAVWGGCKSAAVFIALAGLCAVAARPALAADSYKITAVGSKEAKEGGTLYARLRVYPRTLNRFKTQSDIYTQMVTDPVLENLVDTDFETWDPVPRVAESWEMSKDMLTLTFKINKLAKWSDGTPVTADDVVFTFETIFNEKNDTSSQRGYLDSVKSFKALDPLTVEFKVKYPDCENVAKIGGSPIMQKAVYSKGNFNDDFNNALVGSGPYVFDAKESKKGRKVVLVKNKSWWAKDLPQFQHTNTFDKVVYTHIEDERVAFEAFKKGELSMIDFQADGLDIYAKDVQNNKAFDGSGKFAKLTWPHANPGEWGGIALNMRRAPTDELKFRQALQYLFNYELYTKKIFHDLQTPLLGPFGNYSEYGSPNRKLVKFSPDTAKRLLSELGYKKVDQDGVLYKEAGGKKQRAEITIMFAYLPHEKYLTIFKEDAKKVGVNINLKFSEWAAAMKLVDDFKFDAFVMGWGGNPAPDPSQLWHGKFAMQKASSNIPGFNDPEATKLIETAPGICEKDKRLAAFHQLEDRIVGAQPYIWRWQQKDHYFVYNKSLLSVPSKIWKYSGNVERGQPWPYWWHANPKQDVN